MKTTTFHLDTPTPSRLCSNAGLVLLAATANRINVIATETYPTTSRGYQQIACFLAGHSVDVVGVEGTNSYGAGSPAACPNVATPSKKCSVLPAPYGVGMVSQILLMPLPQPVNC